MRGKNNTTPNRAGWRCFAALVGCLLFGVQASAQFVGPTNAYYLTAGDQRTNFRLQAGSLTSWATSTGGSEYPIFVRGSGIETTASSSLAQGSGYTLAGSPTGARYTLATGITSAWDGTTDGLFNYVVDYSVGTVFRLNLDFTNPVALFTGLGNSTALGITYDATNASLWVSSWNTNTVTNYSMTGTVLRSFSAGAVANSLTSLALDHTTGTLWFGSQLTQGTFYQYSKTGVLLQTITVPGLLNQNTLGGEFNFATVPEPSTLALLALGAIGLLIARRRRA